MVIKHTIWEVRVDILLPYPHPEAIYPLPPPQLLLSLLIKFQREKPSHLGGVLEDNGGAMLGTSTFTKRRGCCSHCCSTGTEGSQGGTAAAWTTDRGWGGGGGSQGQETPGDDRGAGTPAQQKASREEDLQLAGERSETGREQRKRRPGCRGANGRRYKRLQWLS